MRKLAGVIYNTWYGAFLGWGASGLLALLLVYAFGPYQSLGWLVKAIVFVHGSLGVVVSSAVIYSLVKGHLLRAFCQFVLAVASALLFAAGFIVVAFAVTLSERRCQEFEKTEQPWKGSAISELLPFTVEFQVAHPFQAEYHKRIGFRSGKRVGINIDTGGAGKFAVYELEDGCYYLLDGLDRIWIRSEYRVNPKAETVERKCGSLWIRIPDFALYVDGWSDTSLSVETATGRVSVDEGVHVEDSLKSKRFVGVITTQGEFVPGGNEPEIEEDKITWISSPISDEIPFSYARGESRAGRHYQRIAFKSGKMVGIWNWQEEHSVYRLKDGRFLSAEREGTTWERVYRIDADKESVWVHYCGFWVQIPEEATGIENMRKEPDRAVVWIQTKSGNVEVYGDEAVESVFQDAELIGKIDSNGIITN